MIRYALACDEGHDFESWFRDSLAFETQASAGHLSCPVCRSTQVAKQIMAPAIATARRTRGFAEDREAAPPEPSRLQTPQTKDVALLDLRDRELRDLARQLRAKLAAEGHDVGRQFAAEARRIHEGEAPVRQIYGAATAAEARDLLEDGIMILPLPIVPDELN